MYKSTQCYALLLALHVGLVWVLPVFPTQDGPTHLYNLVILHDLLNGGKEWGSFYTHELRAVPNLGFNLVAYPLLKFFPPLTVEKIFVSLYVVLLGISVPVFLRSFGKTLAPFAFFVFPVIFNFTLLMGFYSYSIAVPLFLLASALAWETRVRSQAFKFIFLNLSGLLIFYFHLIPFVFYLLSLFMMALTEGNRYTEKIGNLLKCFLLISPSLLNLFFYLGRGTQGTFPGFSHITSPARNSELLRDLIFFSTVNVSPWQAVPACLLLFLYLFFFSIFLYQTLKARITTKGKCAVMTAAEKVVLGMGSALTLIYLLAPLHFGGGSYFNQRLPWVILLVTLPLLRVPDKVLSGGFITGVCAAVACLFLVFSTVMLRQQSARVEQFLAGLHAGPPKGSFVMTYKTDNEWSRVDVLMHAASYYGIFGGCVDVGNYATTFDYFPVHFRHTLPASPPPAQIDYEPDTIRWSDYPAVQYVLGWEVDEKDRERLGTFFHIVRENGPLSIWRRNSPVPDANS